MPSSVPGGVSQFARAGRRKTRRRSALETVGGSIVFRWGSDAVSLSLPAVMRVSGVSDSADGSALEILSLPLLNTGDIDIK
jgi:hypothetical protein